MSNVGSDLRDYFLTQAAQEADRSPLQRPVLPANPTAAQRIQFERAEQAYADALLNRPAGTLGADARQFLKSGIAEALKDL